MVSLPTYSSYRKGHQPQPLLSRILPLQLYLAVPARNRLFQALLLFFVATPTFLLVSMHLNSYCTTEQSNFPSGVSDRDARQPSSSSHGTEGQNSRTLQLASAVAKTKDGSEPPAIRKEVMPQVGQGKPPHNTTPPCAGPITLTTTKTTTATITPIPAATPPASYATARPAAAAAAGARTRFPNLAIALKTGVDVAAERIPIQLMTFLAGVQNLVVIGESGGTRVGELDIADVYSGTYEQAVAKVGTDVGRFTPSSTATPASTSSATVTTTPASPSPAAAVKSASAAGGEHSRNPDDVDVGLGGGGAPDGDSKPTTATATSAANATTARAPPSRRDSGKKVIPNTGSTGWKLDAHKNLPGFRLLYERFPKADWYVMLDDDTYVYLENLAAHLAKKSLDRPVYTGLKNRFKGCDGVREFGQGPFFAHGGSGIVMNRKALEAMLKIMDVCVVRYHSCWAGDIRLALCMRDAGILLEYDEWLFHKEPPQKEFTYPKNACIRPNVFHHLLPAQIQLLHSAEVRPNGTTFADIFEKLVVGPDLRYAREILKDPGLTPPSTGFAFPDEDAPGGDIKGVAVGSADGYVACSKECLAEEKCVSWSMVGETCWLKNTFSARVEKKGAWSGYLPQRYKCKV